MATSTRTEVSRTKPRGFNLLTRLVFVHAAFFLAVIVPSLFGSGVSGVHDAHVFLACTGIVIAVAGCLTMYGVAKRRSLQALFLLRGLLWIGVVKVSLELLMLLVGSPVETGSSLPLSLVNALTLVAFAIYWTRPVHDTYLALLTTSQDSINSRLG